jgi:hypothetical protein
VIICAFDLATATGVCDGAVGGKPRLFTWWLSDAGDSAGARWHMLHDTLDRYFEKEPCDGVVYELPMPLAVMGDIGAQEATVKFLRGAIGVLEERCYRHGKKVEGLSVQDARQAVLGWRTNKEKKSGIKTKARVMRDVKLLGVECDNDNECDAWVIWSFAAALQNPRVAIQMTPLFRRQ